jgi:hypothetical protein
MKTVNIIKLIAFAALVSALSVQAEEAPAKKKHMVDMADGLGSQEFYESKNPDAIWSSELKMPWAKTSAINAYDSSEKKDSAINAYEEKPKSAAVKQESLAAAAPAKPDAAVGKVNGQEVDGEQLVNIRVLYTLDAEHSRASYSPVSAQNEMYRQMSGVCSQGFQKIAEWSEPVAGSDYYLYYQFKCIDKR